MALSKAEKTKLGEKLDSVEQNLRDVSVSGDRQPISNAHNTLAEIREDHGIEDSE